MKKIISFLIRLIVVFALFSLPTFLGSLLTVIPKTVPWPLNYFFMWAVGFCTVLLGFVIVMFFLMVCTYLFSFDEDLFDFVF